MELIYNLLFSASPEKTSGTKAGLRLQEKTSSERYTWPRVHFISPRRLLIYLSTTRWGRIRRVLATNTKTRRVPVCNYTYIYIYIFVSFRITKINRQIRERYRVKKKEMLVPSNDITRVLPFFVILYLRSLLFYRHSIRMFCCMCTLS